MAGLGSYTDTAGIQRSITASQLMGTGSIATGQVNVTTTAKLVAAARPGRQRIIITATSSVVFYVGTASVTSATGSYVAAGSTITLDTAAAIYAVGAAAVTLSFIELF